MKLSSRSSSSLALLLWLGAALAFAAPESPAPPPAPAPPVTPAPAPQPPLLPQRPGPPPVEKLSPGIYRIGEIVINKSLRTVSFPAQVNMDKGLLEYLLVRNGGKTHESLLRTGVDPYQVQLAFLLLGFEGSDQPLARQGDPARPRGEQVALSLMLMGSDGKYKNVEPQEWIVKKAGEQLAASGKLDLVYTGSVVWNKQFMAQVEGSLVALYHDPVALIDNGSAGGENDKVWFVNAGRIPAPGTPVTVVIRALKNPKGR